MQMNGSLRAIEQYRRNVEGVGLRLDAEETSLDHLTQLMTRAKEIAVGQSGGNANAATRDAAAAEVLQLLEQAVQVGNTTFGDSYLFGGASRTTEAPFDASQTALAPRFVRVVPPAVAPVAPQGTTSVEVGPGQTLRGTHDGDTVFLQTGILQALSDLHTALDTDSSAGIDAAATAIDTSFDGLQAIVGDIGARQNQIDLVVAGFDALAMNLQERRSELSEVEVEEAITEMLNRQTAYQAAMLASSKVMGMSLADYLR
jgi:flagellar hook-associated protein 3 FlgL